MDNLKFYTLMYVSPDESRRFSGKSFVGDEKLDVYVKGACVLDRTLRINEGKSLTLLTNDINAINRSLTRICYAELEVKEIPFGLNVKKGCRFYSAHYKVDVFKYFASLPDNNYSILLDSDVVSVSPLRSDFYEIVFAGIPMVYNLSRYGGERRMRDVSKIVDDVKWLAWAGGEFIGGLPSFFNLLYEDICSFKENYWANIDNDLFHVGDEMLTSIALNHCQFNTIDAGVHGFIYRYWSIYEELGYGKVGASLIHFPGDKEYFKRVNLQANTVDEFMKKYKMYRIKCLLKGYVKKILDKDWMNRL